MAQVKTKEEAKKILEQSKELAPYTDDEGEVWHYHISGFVKEYPNEGFVFAVHPYSAKTPINPKYAFNYIVFSDNGEIDSATTRMTEEELKKIQPL